MRIYEEENNPILAYVKEAEEKNMINNEPTDEVYTRYHVYMANNGFGTPVSKTSFTRVLGKLGYLAEVKTIPGKKSFRMYVKV